MKNKKLPNIISLAILTLITSVVWIFFNVYRVFTTKTEPKVSREILQPLSPKLNSEIISEIENRVFIEQNQIPETPVEQVVPIPTETEEPVSTPEATASATPEATVSAEIEND